MAAIEFLTKMYGTVKAAHAVIKAHRYMYRNHGKDYLNQQIWEMCDKELANRKREDDEDLYDGLQKIRNGDKKLYDFLSMFGYDM